MTQSNLQKVIELSQSVVVERSIIEKYGQMQRRCSTGCHDQDQHNKQQQQHKQPRNWQSSQNDLTTASTLRVRSPNASEAAPTANVITIGTTTLTTDCQTIQREGSNPQQKLCLPSFTVSQVVGEEELGSCESTAAVQKSTCTIQPTMSTGLTKSISMSTFEMQQRLQHLPENGEELKTEIRRTVSREIGIQIKDNRGLSTNGEDGNICYRDAEDGTDKDALNINEGHCVNTLPPANAAVTRSLLNKDNNSDMSLVNGLSVGGGVMDKQQKQRRQHCLSSLSASCLASVDPSSNYREMAGTVSSRQPNVRLNVPSVTGLNAAKTTNNKNYAIPYNIINNYFSVGVVSRRNLHTHGNL